MDPRFTYVGGALLILAVIILLATRFLTRRARLTLYAAILVVAASAWGYVYYNLNLRPDPYILEPWLDGFTEPLQMLPSPLDDGRLYVVERAGLVRIIQNDAITPTPFLDLRQLVNDKVSEQGLLSLAFHPDFATNGFFYVYYTNDEPATILARYHASTSDAADPTTGVELLHVPQPANQHNGGLVTFGPDGYLYLGLGDGGKSTGASPAQEPTAFLGKLLRVDVANPAADPPYAIPPDNPFRDDPTARPEIYALGLRNPWRYAFHPDNGDLYIADVGGGKREEINLLPAGESGLNFGWKWYEGSERFDNGLDTEPPTWLTDPFYEYDHLALGGCSIIGGPVYAGAQMPELYGQYLFGDYCTGFIWALDRDDAGNPVVTRLLRRENFRLAAFGHDHAGEIYPIDIAAGRLYRLMPGNGR